MSRPSSSFAPFDPLASGRELTAAGRRSFAWRPALAAVAVVGALAVSYGRDSQRAAAQARAEAAAQVQAVECAIVVDRALAGAIAFERDLDREILALKIAQAKRAARNHARATVQGGLGTRGIAGNRLGLGIGGVRARGSIPD